MKNRIWILGLMVFWMAEWRPLRGQSLVEAGRLSDSGNHVEAIAAYRSMISKGKDSSVVRFNLGTTLLRAGRLGEALAELRIAERGMPRDAALQTNLAVVQARLESSHAGATSVRRLEAPGRRWWTSNELGMLTLIASTLAAVLAIWSWRRPSDSVPLTPYRWVAGLVALALVVLFGREWWLAQRGGDAVVIASSSVHHGPLAESPVAFRLVEGTEVRMVDQFGDWIQVRDPVTGSSGWISRQRVTGIPWW